MTGNRILEHAARVQAAVDSGQKIDGTGPMGDLDALERSLELDFSEHAAYLQATAEACAAGVLTTDEAQTVYAGLGGCLGQWPMSTPLALKVTITSLMGELVAAGVRV